MSIEVIGSLSGRTAFKFAAAAFLLMFTVTIAHAEDSTKTDSTVETNDSSASDSPADEPQGPESKVSSYSIDCKAPCIQTEDDFELENDWTRFGPAESTSSNDFYPSVEADVKVRPLDWLMLSGHLVTESVLDLDPGNDRFLGDVGTYAEELYALLLFGDVEIVAGKFHPAFGLAWDVPPGLHATDLAGDYELIEMIGSGIAYRFAAFGMEHHAQASLFTLDRSFLSDSLFTHRGQTTLSDGGAGNTAGISSAALALDGCAGELPKDCIDSGDWGYHVAVRYQEAGVPQRDDDDELIPTGDEKGLVGALYKSFNLPRDGRLTLFGEAAYFADFEASRDDALFFTGMGMLKHKPLTYSITYTHETRWVDGNGKIFRDLVDASIDYELAKRFSLTGEKWTFGPGYTFFRDEGQDVHIFGVHLKAEFDGKWPKPAGDEGD
jgi:hypothetical protein